MIVNLLIVHLFTFQFTFNIQFILLTIIKLNILYTQ